MLKGDLYIAVVLDCSHWHSSFIFRCIGHELCRCYCVSPCYKYTSG